MSAPEPQDDVQEFAALLRRLKERTDRSYGSLARRLNMNTSTLHRYCAGDAVPVDFAPAERLAALCGASAEERMDLHRLWLSAVAARQRPRAGEAAGTVGATATEAAVGEECGAAATDGATATADRAPAADGGTSATADEVDAAGGGAANGGTAGEVNAATDSHAVAGGAASRSVAGAAAGGGAADQVSAANVGTAVEVNAANVGAAGEVGASVEGEGDALLAGRGAAARRPWYRRRRVAMTVAAAVALLATLGSLSALPSGRSASDEVAQAPDPSSPTTTTASGSPGHSPSKSPSPSATFA